MKKKQISYGLLIALCVIGLDQWSKWYVLDYLIYLDQHTLSVTSFFNLVIVWNYGVSFGLFSGLTYGPIILTVVTIGITGYLCYWLTQVKTSWMVGALGLIIGGAIGNIIDRIRVGAVADFLDFHLWGYHWPAFNVADSCVFIGVMMIIWDSLWIRGEEQS